MTTGNQGQECSGQGAGQKEWKEPCVRSLSTCVRGRQGTCLNQNKKGEERKKKSHFFINSFLKRCRGAGGEYKSPQVWCWWLAGFNHHHSSMSVNQPSVSTSTVFRRTAVSGGVKGHAKVHICLQLKKNQQLFGRQRVSLSHIDNSLRWSLVITAAIQL